MSVDPAVAAAANAYLSLPMNFGEPTNLILIAERDAWVAAVEWLVGHPEEYARLSRQTTPADEWEYRYAEVFDDGEMYTYGSGANGDMGFPTYEAAHAARVEDTDIVVRRRRSGQWEPVSS
ncbi:hypothetical protein [Microbacterium sp. ProA8]|uniref:hypothetical protein n=1 Tax=Microbacterium chionoecetis TaxID=3153754 RepID=UPI003263682A